LEFPVLHIEAIENNLRSQDAWINEDYHFEFQKHAGNHETVMRGGNAKSLATLIARFLQIAV
jgi:hypothetical protein